MRAKRQGEIATIHPALMALQETGFRMTAALYGEALRLAGEDARP